MRKTFLLLRILLLSQVSFAQHPGSLDSTFGNNGIVVYPATAPTTSYEWTSAIAQPDKKIVVVGYGGSVGGLLARYNADGVPDTAFNHTGLIMDGLYQSNVIMQPDGKDYCVCLKHNKKI